MGALLLGLGGCGIWSPAGVTVVAEDAACAAPRFDLAPAAQPGEPGGRPIQYEGKEWGLGPSFVTGKDITSARVERQGDGWVLQLRVEEGARAALEQGTADQVGGFLAVLLDDYPVSIPLVRAPLTGRELKIYLPTGDALAAAHRLEEQVARRLPCKVER